MTSYFASQVSTSVRMGAGCATGPTPPIAWPVQVRTELASARATTAAPIRDATREVLTRCAPLVITSSGAPSAANTRLFAIAPTSHPSCFAAAAAVGAGSGSSRTSPVTPSDLSTPANPEKSTAMPITLPAPRGQGRSNFASARLGHPRGRLTSWGCGPQPQEEWGGGTLPQFRRPGSRSGPTPGSGVLAIAGVEDGGGGGGATSELQRVGRQFRQDGLVTCARRGKRFPSDDLPLPDQFAQQHPVRRAWVRGREGDPLGQCLARVGAVPDGPLASAATGLANRPLRDRAQRALVSHRGVSEPGQPGQPGQRRDRARHQLVDKRRG